MATQRQRDILMDLIQKEIEDGQDDVEVDQEYLDELFELAELIDNSEIEFIPKI